MTQLICRVVIGVGGCWAAYLNASEPLIWATASPQPALTLRAEPVPVSSLPRFDQAQGRDL
jgi:hypothetical protein